MRIDKWLWAVRIFKTRSLATDFCKKGRVAIGDIPVKPSRQIQPGEVVAVRKPPVNYTYRITALTNNRVSAKIAMDFVQDLTPEEELEKLKTIHESAFFIRERGAGRPTKKERRDIDKFQS